MNISCSHRKVRVWEDILGRREERWRATRCVEPATAIFTRAGCVEPARRRTYCPARATSSCSRVIEAKLGRGGAAVHAAAGGWRRRPRAVKRRTAGVDVGVVGRVVGLAFLDKAGQARVRQTELPLVSYLD